MQKTKEKDPKAHSPSPSIEGEGSYVATRRYDAAVEKTVQSGEVPKLAKEAARALDGPEGAELRDAEKAARSGKTEHQRAARPATAKKTHG